MLTPPRYNLNAAGKNGTGHCFSSGTVNEAFLVWCKEVPKPWPSDEFYVSFWMRFPSYRMTDRVNENFKIFYPHWNGASSYVHFSLANPDAVYYSAKARGTMVAYGKWLNCPDMTDGRWHHYEFYVGFSRGVSQFRYDGVLVLDDEYGRGRWTNDMYYFPIPSIDAQEPGVFSRQVDDLEIWDGFPGVSDCHPLSGIPCPSGKGGPSFGKPIPGAGVMQICSVMHVQLTAMAAARAFSARPLGSPVPGSADRLPLMASCSQIESIMRR